MSVAALEIDDPFIAPFGGQLDLAIADGGDVKAEPFVIGRLLDRVRISSMDGVSAMIMAP